MKKLFILITLCTSTLCVAQVFDPYQTDSLYRAHKVKSRIETSYIIGSKIQFQYINSYDTSGHLVESSFWRIQKKKKLMVENTRYVYDKGRLVAENSYHETIVTSKKIYVYDSEDQLIRIQTSSSEGKPTEEMELTYHPMVKHTKEFDSEGQVKMETYTYYEDKAFVLKQKQITVRNNPDAKTDTMYYTWEKKALENKTNTLTITHKSVIVEYVFDDKGLLLKWTSKLGDLVVMEHIYGYEFWE